MQSAPEDFDRRVVPRWRSILRTPWGELDNYRTAAPINEYVIDQFRQCVSEWSGDPSFNNAQELIWACYVAPPSLAAPALRALKDRGPKALREMAQRILDRRSFADIELTLDASRARDVLGLRIKGIKSRVAAYSSDPIAFTELAMLYMRLGQEDHAHRAIRIAHGLAPDLRYILRSATRFLVHIGRYDEALKWLQQSDSRDPWILSCLVTLYDLMGRQPPNFAWHKNL